MDAMKSIYDPNYIAVINRLKQVRKAKRFTQADLADRLDWNNRDISKVENFTRRLDIIELCYWLDALEYDLETFLRDIGRIQ